MANNTEPETYTKKSSAFKELKEWIIAIFLGVMLAMLVRTFLFTFAKVDGTSMVPTLQDGQRVLVNIITETFRPYERGDIIVFHYNSSDDYVKRIIALGGEEVYIKDSIVYVNGEALTEPYLPEGLVYDDFGPITVPQGEYFVLGDNRPLSHDSRYSDVGTIKPEQILGKVEFSLFPFETF